MMHVTTTGAQLRISQEFLTRQTWYCNEEGKGEQVVVAAKGFHFTMGLKKVCPRNPELNPVVTCITPHASHNDLANTEKKIHIMSCYIRHACHTSHSRKTPKVQNSSSKFKITRCRMGPKQPLVVAAKDDISTSGALLGIHKNTVQKRAARILV